MSAGRRPLIEGGTITASGSTGGTDLVLTAPTFIKAVVGPTAASRTLTLQGSNTDAKRIAGSIVDVETKVLPAITTATLLTKSNAGRWILAGDSTFTGASSVTGGNLTIRRANALGSTVAGTTVSNAGADNSFVFSRLKAVRQTSKTVATVRSGTVAFLPEN